MSSAVILAFMAGLWLGTCIALILFFLLSKEDPPHDKQ